MAYLITVIAIPLILVFSSITRHIKDAIILFNELQEKGLPSLPKWLVGLPYIGHQIAEFWSQLQASPQQAFMLHEQQTKYVFNHIMRSGIGILALTFQAIIGIIISAIFLYQGEKILNPVKAAMEKLIGKKQVYY